MTSVVTLKGVERSFIQGGRTLSVLRGLDLDVQPGELVAIVGPSGSGKTSLLNVIGALDGGFSGEAKIFDRTLRDLNDDGRTKLRNELIGFVFQSFHLLDHLSVLENVKVPLWLAGNASADEETKRAQDALQSVGLGDRSDSKVTLLSGGERQRVAIARAIVHRPRLVLADEPTGNLDIKTGSGVIDIFDDIRKAEDGKRCAVVVVTHDERIARRADRILTLRDGKLVASDLTDESVSGPAAPAEAREAS